MKHEDFMRLALGEADRAMAAGEFPVGCVLVHGERVLVGGSRQASHGTQRNELDHAEMVALRRMHRLADTPPQGLTLYSTMEPCLMCFAALMLAGIATIVYAYEDAMGGGTACDLESLPALYRQRRPQIVGGVMRRESLIRFHAFFSDPQNDYWRGSALAAYTLSQVVATPGK
jgi:tRNA(adenine34) deaminase